MPFSFDRDTVKAIGKLGVSNHGNDFSDGVTLSNNVLMVNNNSFSVKTNSFVSTYLDKQGIEKEFDVTSSVTDRRFIGYLHLDNRTLPREKVKYHVDFELLRDR
jgi:hypothetical protein